MKKQLILPLCASLLGIAVTFFSRYYNFETEVALVQLGAPLVALPFIQLLINSAPIYYGFRLARNIKIGWVVIGVNLLVLLMLLSRIKLGFVFNDWTIGMVYTAVYLLGFLAFVYSLFSNHIKVKRWPAFAVFGLALGFGFYRKPIYQSDIVTLKGVEYGKEVNHNDFGAVGFPNSGLVFFISSGCDYCFSLYNKTMAWSGMKDIPHKYYLQGSPESNDFFFERSLARGENIHPIADSIFFKYCGPSLPSVVQVENGQVINYWSGDDFGFPNLLELRQ